MPLTEMEALEQMGNSIPDQPDVKWPGINPSNYSDYMTFYQTLYALAGGAPLLANASYSPPVSFFDDFIEGGYVPDLALASESDPGGKFSEVAERGAWLFTKYNAASLVIADEKNGIAHLLTGSTEEDAGSIQLNGTSFKLEANKPLYYETRLRVEDPTACTWIAGLSIPETDPTGSGVFGTSDDAIGFFGLQALATSAFWSTDGVDDEIASLVTLVADTYTRLGFYWDGIDTISFYQDGVCLTDTTSAATIAATTCNVSALELASAEAMSPIFAVDSTTGATAEYLDIDYVFVVQTR